MTPSAVSPACGEGWFIGFVKDGEESGESGEKRGLRRREEEGKMVDLVDMGMDDNARFVSELNARWETDDYEAITILAMAGNGKGKGKRGSMDSIQTVWPGSKDKELDIGSRRLDLLGPDEFRNEAEIDDGGSLASRHWLISPDEFDLENLERELCSPVDRYEFERQELMPIRPMHSPEP